MGRKTDMPNLSFIKNRIAKTMAAPSPCGGGGNGTPLLVTWRSVSGGTYNPSTGAMVGGSETIYSGTLSALVAEAPPKTVLRQFQEIQAGDLIVRTGPNAVVDVFPNQSPVSGCWPLQALANSGVRFFYNNTWYAQASIGEDLANIWNLVFQGVPLMGGLLLRRAT